jgi:hypothetical protein
MSTFGAAQPDSIAHVWLNTATAYASTRGYSFDASCLEDLKQLLDNGATQLRSSNLEAKPEDYVGDVEHLVSYMITELQKQSPGETVLHEWTLLSAQKSLCPLFPFC